MVFVDLAKRFRIGGVNCWNDREVVLIFVEIVLRESIGVVEWVRKALVEWAKRELVYVVREVEGWVGLVYQCR